MAAKKRKPAAKKKLKSTKQPIKNLSPRNAKGIKGGARAHFEVFARRPPSS
jgi:hypothetical protein